MKQLPPGDLELVQAFVNSYEDECDGTKEELATPVLAHAWLVENELLDGGTSVSEADRLRLVQVREALRSLLRANNGGSPEPGAVDLLNKAAATAPLVLCIEEDGGAWLDPATDGVNAAIGRIVAIVFAAMIAGTWQRLKVCRDRSCLWAFFDSSKNHSATWCSMRTCGNRAKVRAYQERRRAAAT